MFWERNLILILYMKNNNFKEALKISEDFLKTVSDEVAKEFSNQIHRKVLEQEKNNMRYQPRFEPLPYWAWDDDTIFSQIKPDFRFWIATMNGTYVYEKKRFMFSKRKRQDKKFFKNKNCYIYEKNFIKNTVILSWLPIA